MNQLVQKFVTEDGKQFDTKAEALSYLRRPHQEKAFNALNKNNAELTAWLIDNQDEIESTFESTKVRRVTKQEKKALEKALEVIKAANDKAYAFLADNAEAIVESFRWPSVKRMTPEESSEAIQKGFMELTEGNADVTKWLIANKDAILECYQAGVVKREINPKAQDALKAYRERKAAEKAAAEATKAA